MGDKSKIEWTEATWTPIRARWFEPQNDGSGKERIGWHCEHVSEGCRNCYAEGINLRLGTGLPFKPDHRRRQIHINFSTEWRGDVTVFLDENMLLQPLRWKRPRMIFVGSMTDIFADFVKDAWLDQMFAVIAACPQHTFQVLTKRPARMRAYTSDPDLPRRLARTWCTVGRNEKNGWSGLSWQVSGDDAVPRQWPLPNVWLGTSCEDQPSADARIPHLLATPAAIRFVSAEPLLGPIDLDTIWLRRDGARATELSSRLGDYVRPLRGAFTDSPRISWIIVGGESGPHARPMHPDWARSIRDQCAAAGVSFHFKQWGGWLPYQQWGSSESAGDALWRKDWMILSHCGSLDIPDDCWPDEDAGECAVLKVTKDRAGRLLDGVEHNGMPSVSSETALMDEQQAADRVDEPAHG